jgi:hypothetical protein
VRPDQRFTIDGSARLEAFLAQSCASARDAVLGLLPDCRIEALVLGGGYGRGEGGVLSTASGDQPYNDLEFYLFLRGNRLLNERLYRCPLLELAEALTRSTGVHVEFKIESLPRMRATGPTMFSYDLVSRHVVMLGGEETFEGCEHHLDPAAIPASEATRVLFNRCSGLLLARERLRQETITAEDADFVGRNLAKAQLALGDAVLTICGLYHWSCRERHARLRRLQLPNPLPWFRPVVHHHGLGALFKLHPQQEKDGRAGFLRRWEEIQDLAGSVWLWVESSRLGVPFSSMRDYALHSGRKCAESPAWRNLLLNLRTFGFPALLDASSRRYPRERLYNALALLLWDEDALETEAALRRLCGQLRTKGAEWQECLSAYQRVWAAYG